MNPVGKHPLQLFRLFLNRDSWCSHILRMLAGSPGARHDTLGTSIVFWSTRALVESRCCGIQAQVLFQKTPIQSNWASNQMCAVGTHRNAPVSGPAWAERPRWSELNRGAKVNLTLVGFEEDSWGANVSRTVGGASESETSQKREVTWGPTWWMMWEKPRPLSQELQVTHSCAKSLR